ncbi:MAG: DUF58 domain-containing protein [Oscillochloridaceae bacterium umkhey_bin13]
MNNLRILTLIILALAALLRSEIFFYLLYVLVGLQLAAWAWVWVIARGLRWSRELPAALFPGEPAEVRLIVRNASLLPIPWLVIHESVPPALRLDDGVRRVVSLAANEQRAITYSLRGQRRGLYQVGPLRLRTGDALGLFERPLDGGTTSSLVVYPHVVPLPKLGLPAGLPFGARPEPGGLFSDPARPAGPRDYHVGDGLRQIDWKSSARVGGLQVRRHEPALARVTLLALAFSRSEYPGRYLHDELERAIIATASLAADLIGRGQPVGMYTSGRDGLSAAPAAPLLPASGRTHLMNLLSLLGRLEAPPEADLLHGLDRATAKLGWGSTVVVIAATAPSSLIERLLPVRRRGLRLALVLVESSAADLALARRHGVACYLVDRTGVPS